MVNQFRLHYAKNIVHFQAAIQISRILEEEEEENNRSEHFLKKPSRNPRLLGFQLNMMNTFKYNTAAPGSTAPNRTGLSHPFMLR